MSADDADPLAALTTRMVAILRARAPNVGAAVELALRALFAGLQDGHTCVRLADLAATAPPGSPLADAGHCERELLASGVVAAPDAAADVVLPLSLDARGRLYLFRHRAAERRVAAALRARLQLAAAPPAAALAALRAIVDAAEPVDWQAIAVAAALRSRCCVITGGPGTGKTTTIQKLLRVLLAGAPDLRVGLVAPTGKAAARMTGSLQTVFAEDRVPRATTLHRLLGYLALEDVFRRHARDPLPHDLVVVDEASMVDLELMDALLQALKPEARLVLLGDRDQLSSVAAGQVLGDLCAEAATATGVGAGLAAFCRAHLDIELPARASSSPFADAVVALRRNWRFASTSAVGAFAQAVVGGDADGALAAATRGEPELAVVPPAPAAQLLAPWTAALLAQVDVDGPAAALRAQATLRILCATRHGPFGVDALNTAVEALLTAHGHDASGPFYRGRPVLITQNDHQSGLFNGDLGVLWPDDDGRPMAWFAADRGEQPRAFLPLRLPPHETAWAMTVHKSQGSEFDRVLVVLPDRPSPLLHAPLVYTAVTRARTAATIAADPALLRAALGARPVRGSGLLDLLHAPSTTAVQS